MNSGASARIRWSWLVPGAMLGMATCAAAPASPAQGPLSVPFDFTRSVIEIGVTVRGTPLHMIVDTGVDPSIVDLAVADKLGLAIDRGDGGEASGFGDGKGAAVFPTSIDAIALAGRGFGRFDALATSYRFDAPPGIVVSTYSMAGARDTRVANVGNRLLAAMKLRLLIDYPRRTMTFHGDCA